jgi:uncharacterized membrane-anchored protein
MLSASLIVLATLAAFAAPAIAQGEVSFGDIAWQKGPTEGRLGDVARIDVPAGYAFAPKGEMKKFMALTQNIHTGDELGVLLPMADDQQWFVIFEFDPIGYVKDGDRDQLDADKLLASIREGTEAANKERRKRGWDEMQIVGWATPPNYDAVTNNLQWAILGAGSEGQSVNHSTRLLGRKGVMSADLVANPGDLPSVMPAYQSLLTGYSFTEGNRYAEFIKGDKVAAVGLTALIAGGAGVALAKSGFLGKFFKVIVVAVVALFATLGRWLMGLFRGLAGRDKTITHP